MSHFVLDHLLTHGPSTIAEIGRASHMGNAVVMARLESLYQGGYAQGLSRPNLPPVFVAVTDRGGCEFCGLYSHHRVAALCPACVRRSTGLENPVTRPARGLSINLNLQPIETYQRSLA